MTIVPSSSQNTSPNHDDHRARGHTGAPAKLVADGASEDGADLAHSASSRPRVVVKSGHTIFPTV